MRIAVFVFVLGVAFIFSVLCANVVFVSKCSSIGKLMQSFNASLIESAGESPVDTIQVTNRFSRGSIVVVPSSGDSTGQMLLNVYGNEVCKQPALGYVISGIKSQSLNDSVVRFDHESQDSGRKATDFYQKSVVGTNMSFTVSPLDVTRFLWIDGSCQVS